MSELHNKNIILAISGGIAAYKTAELTRLLVKQGAHVQIVMTTSALQFISPITLQALSTHPIRSELFDTQAEAAMGHIELAQWADIIIIAPATANTIAKITYGLADNLLSTLCLASKAPLLIVPAMNQQMWLNEATQTNIKLLNTRKQISLCGPAIGEQACGDNGPGRMESPENIVHAVCSILKNNEFASSSSTNHQTLKNKRIIITAGPTIEDIDPVRYISNRSSGKMGYAIAQAAQAHGAEVLLISGPVNLAEPNGIEVQKVRSAQQMHKKVFQSIHQCDYFIATAAVADYRPNSINEQKIKKTAQTLTIEMSKNPDILAEVAQLNDRPITIGFAAETQNLDHYAKDKLQRKNLDMIVANPVGKNQGFDHDQNELHLFWHNSEQKIAYKKLAYADKHILAKQLINEISILFNH